MSSHADIGDPPARDPATGSGVSVEPGAGMDVAGMVVAHMAVGVVGLDGRGHVVFANPAARQMLQIASAEAPNHPLRELLRDAVGEDGVPLAIEERLVDPIRAHEASFDQLVLGIRRAADDQRQWLLISVVKGSTPTVVPEIGVILTIEDITARKAIEIALQQQNRVVDQVHEAVMVWDWSDGITFWNAGAEELYGFTATEALGHTSHALLHTEMPGGHDELRAALDRDGEWKGDIGRRRKDGTRITVEARLALTRQGDRLAVVEADRDVTSRRRAEERQQFLAESSRVLTSALDIEATLTTLTQLAVPAMADWCVVDLVDREGALNRLAITHRDPALAPVAAELRLRYPRLMPNQSHTLWTVLHQQRPFVDPAVDGERFVAQARDARHAELLRQLGFAAELVVPLIARGRVLGAITLVLGNHERSFSDDDVALAQEVGRTAALAIDNARLYADARAAEAYYRSLLKGTVDGVVVTDEHGRYLEINPAAERLLGYAIDELQVIQETGGSFSAEHPSVRGEVWSQLEQTGQWSGQWTIRRKDGALMPVDVTATRVTLPDQSVYIAIWRDVSQRVRLERLQRDFFAMVTHDLRTPLTVIRSSAQMLQMRREYREAAVARILSASDRMVRLINDLADLVSLEDGHIALHREPVRLGELAREVVTTLPEADRPRVVVEPMDHEVEGNWDPARLGQVLQNLIDNALSHAPGSSVQVSVESTDGDARVTVSDDGPGIDPEHVPLLFERFYRASATGAGGLGLGLYICRMLVEAHGGRISVESSPGNGSSFWVTLPRAG